MDNKINNSFLKKIGRFFSAIWNGFWLVIHKSYLLISLILRFIKHYIWQLGLWRIVKLVSKGIYLITKYIFKYTIVFLVVTIVRLLVSKSANKDYYLRKAEKSGYWLSITALVIIFVIFYDFIFDYTIGYLFRFSFLLIGQMNNKLGEIFLEFNGMLWSGTKITIILSVLGTMIGFILALLMALLITQKTDKRNKYSTMYLKRFGRFLTKIYVTIIRSTPMMVQGMVIYYGFLSPVLGLNATSSIIPAVVIVSLNTAAYLTEVIRGGIESIDKGQTEGARSLGMSSWQTMISVIYPQAIKNSMPAIGNELIINIKDTSVLSVIMVADIFYICSKIIYNVDYDWTAYLVAALIYLALTLTFSQILKQITKKLDVKPRSLPSAN